MRPATARASPAARTSPALSAATPATTSKLPQPPASLLISPASPSRQPYWLPRRAVLACRSGAACRTFVRFSLPVLCSLPPHRPAARSRPRRSRARLPGRPGICGGRYSAARFQPALFSTIPSSSRAKRREALRPRSAPRPWPGPLARPRSRKLAGSILRRPATWPCTGPWRRWPVAPAHLLVDGNRFRPLPGFAHTCIIGGDGLYRNIAAASVLAKTFRDEHMQDLAAEFPAYGWEQNAGYPTRQPPRRPSGRTGPCAAPPHGPLLYGCSERSVVQSQQ